MNFIGIDVGSEEMVVVVIVNGKAARKAKTFENTTFGHKLIIQLLSKLKG